MFYVILHTDFVCGMKNKRIVQKNINFYTGYGHNKRKIFLYRLEL